MHEHQVHYFVVKVDLPIDEDEAVDASKNEVMEHEVDEKGKNIDHSTICMDDLYDCTNKSTNKGGDLLREL